MGGYGFSEIQIAPTDNCISFMQFCWLLCFRLVVKVTIKPRISYMHILYAYNKYLHKNIIQHGDSQKPEERTRESSLKVMYDMKYIPSNNSN